MRITRYAQSQRSNIVAVGLLWQVYQGTRNLAECFYCINWFPIRFGNKLVLLALVLWITSDDIPHKNEHLHTMGFGIKNWSRFRQSEGFCLSITLQSFDFLDETCKISTAEVSSTSMMGHTSINAAGKSLAVSLGWTGGRACEIQFFE